jgi:hypothetical protein
MGYHDNNLRYQLLLRPDIIILINLFRVIWISK